MERGTWNRFPLPSWSIGAYDVPKPCTQSTSRGSVMRTAALIALAIAIGILARPADLVAQKKVAEVAKEEVKKTDPAKEEAFDQKKADLETIKSGGYTDDVKSLTDFFRNHTVAESDKAKITALIKKLGDDVFEEREAA